MIDYKTFMKHAAKLCNNPYLDTVERHQILKGVRHYKNGDAVVTDAHRLYLAKNIHNKVYDLILTPEGRVLEGNYPDIKRLLPDSGDARQELEINVGELLEASDTIYNVGKFIDVEKPPTLELAKDTIRYDSSFLKYSKEMSVTFAERVFLNAKYVLDAAKLFKAAKCQTVTFRFFGRLRPITLTTADESLLVLILPIRKS